MKKYVRIRDILLGALIATLVISLASTALAALDGKTIDVYTGLKVYVNDQLVDPKDVNGDPVDVLVYNGTTYLPIRAVGNALGLPVQYDAATQSAFVGTHRSGTPAFYLDEFDYFSGTADNRFYTSLTMDDNLKQGHSRCITESFDRTYKLNGQYTRLTGTMFQEYEKRSSTVYSGLGLWIYGDGKILYAREFKEDTTGIEPEMIDIDLTGVLELQIIFKARGYDDASSPLSLGEMALYT